MAKAAATPTQKMPCDSEKTSTASAPEQGRAPAVTIVVAAAFQSKPGADSTSGSGIAK